MKRFTFWILAHKQSIGLAAPFLILPLWASAATFPISTGIPPLSNAAGATALLCNIMNAMFWVLLSVSVIMCMWAAFLYITSEGDSEKPSQAKMTLLYAMIGIVVALAAKGFPGVVASIFPNSAVHACEVVSSTVTPIPQ